MRALLVVALLVLPAAAVDARSHPAPSASAALFPAKAPLLGASHTTPAPTPGLSGLAALRDYARVHGLAAATEPAANLTATGADLLLYPAGDANGDGHDDVFALQVLHKPDQGVDERLELRSGADLTQKLWGLETKGGEGAAVVPDVDGDGFPDVLYEKLGDVSSDSKVVPAVVAGAYTSTVTYAVHQELRSGKTGATLKADEGSVTFDGTDAYAFALLVLADAWRDAISISGIYAAGQGVYDHVRVDLNMTFLLAYAVAADDFQYGWTQNVALAGAAGSRAANDRFDDVRSAVGGRFDAKAGADLALLVSNDPTPYYGTVPMRGLVAQDRIEAWGADGALLWAKSFDRSQAQAAPRFLDGVGDVDGDGLDDLALTVQAGGGETVQLLSGKDGSVLGTPTHDGFFLLGPFGDVDHDGKAELLVLSLSNGVVHLDVAKPDLKPVWGTDLDERTLAAVVDATGDGVPDLLAADEASFRGYHYKYDGEKQYAWTDPSVNVTLTVRDGTTGKAAWALKDEPAVAWSLVEGVAGKGLDLFVAGVQGDPAKVAAADLTDATVRGRLLSGADGAPVWERILRTPGPGPQYTDYAAVTLGNLDATGRKELGLRIEDGKPYDEKTPVDGADGADGWVGDAVQRWAVFSVDSGQAQAVIQAHPSDGLQFAPAEAAPGEAPSKAGKATPGPELALLAAALALLAVRRRK